ncbi:MAG: response regulator [Treponema sp.]|jgi:putative two-component system response regulator|nr:response regulator [Treponema sp.]
MEKTIFVVDDNDTNLAKAKQALEGHYRVFPLPSAAKMFSLLEKIVPDMILLDIKMPEMNGFEAIQKLKADKRFGDIPVIFLTANINEESELEGFDLGAADYMSKPFSVPRLLKRVATQLLIASQKKDLLASQVLLNEYANNLEQKVRDKTKEVVNLQNAVLTTVADLVEFRDKHTGGHISRTQLYLSSLIEELDRERIYTSEIVEWDRDFLLPSAQLHDVGKIAIPDLILNKPGKLTPEEFEIMKTHVTAGVAAINKIMSVTEEHAFLRYALLFAGTHHEKWDGTGYPAGLKGAGIPLEGRLMAIADVYDALISTRPYKKPFTHGEAKKIIEESGGTHFDPVLVDVFRSVSDEFAHVAQRLGA